MKIAEEKADEAGFTGRMKELSLKAAERVWEDDSLTSMRPEDAASKVFSEFEDEFKEVAASRKPIRSMKLTPKLVKFIKESEKWKKEKIKEYEGYRDEEAAFKKKNEERKAKALAEIEEVKEKMKALVNVEMGISSVTHDFRINVETLELEILSDDSSKKKS